MYSESPKQGNITGHNSKLHDSARDDEYTFATPFLKPTCTCQCPITPLAIEPAKCKAQDKCNGASNCIEWEQPSDNVEGCFIDDIKLSSIAGLSKICCKIFLSKNETFTSYKISDDTRKTAAKITTAVYLHGTNHSVLSKSTWFSPDNSGSSFIDGLNVSMKVTIDVEDQPVLGKVYYNKEDESTVLLAEKDINSKDSREVEKIGWLRIENGDISLDDKTVENFKNLFSATAGNCAKSVLTTKFTGTHSSTNNQTLASKFGNQMTSAERRGSGKVVIIPRMATIVLTITQSSSNELTLYTDVMSKVTNFTALLVVDKNSNPSLHLTFTDTSGYLRGVLTAGNQSEAFHLFVDEEVSNLLQPVAVECVKDDTRLCLFTVWPAGDHTEACNAVQCKTVELENPEGTNGTIKYTKGEKDSLLNPLSWLKYANPKEWFNGIDSAAEGFIVAVVIILSIIALSVLICVIRCCCTIYTCCTCCKCRKNRRRKRYEGREMFEETHL